MRDSVSSAANHVHDVKLRATDAQGATEIEVVGTMPPNARSGNAQASQDPERTAHPMAGTVNVKTVTMLASTCR